MVSTHSCITLKPSKPLPKIHSHAPIVIPHLRAPRPKHRCQKGAHPLLHLPPALHVLNIHINRQHARTSHIGDGSTLQRRLVIPHPPKHGRAHDRRLKGCAEAQEGELDGLVGFEPDVAGLPDGVDGRVGEVHGEVDVEQWLEVGVVEGAFKGEGDDLSAGGWGVICGGHVLDGFVLTPLDDERSVLVLTTF